MDERRIRIVADADVLEQQEVLTQDGVGHPGNAEVDRFAARMARVAEETALAQAADDAHGAAANSVAHTHQPPAPALGARRALALGAKQR